MKSQINTSFFKDAIPCNNCPQPKDESCFCHVVEYLKNPRSLGRPLSYPKGVTLFREGESPQGLFVVCWGRVKLFVSGSNGRSVISKIAGSGDALGLSDLLLEQPYAMSAETLEPVQVKFLFHGELMGLMQTHGEIGRHTAKYLSRNLRSSHQQLVRIAITQNPQSKLIDLLFDLAGGAGLTLTNGSRFYLPLTHQQIGDLLGITRETVCRLLGELRKAELIQVKGTSVNLQDISGLKKLRA